VLIAVKLLYLDDLVLTLINQPGAPIPRRCHGSLRTKDFLRRTVQFRQNRFAVKVIGSPFRTFQEAEKACEAILGTLKSHLA